MVSSRSAVYDGVEGIDRVFPPDLIERLANSPLSIPGLGWRSWWVGALVGLGLALVFLVGDMILRPPQSPFLMSGQDSLGELLLEETILAGLIAYIITSHNITRYAFLSNIVALRGSLAISDERLFDLARDFIARRARGQMLALIIGPAIGLPAAYPVFADLSDMPILLIAILVKVAIVFALVALATFDAWIAQRFIVRLTRQGLKLNLLDLSPIEPIGRFGSQTAMAIVIGCALSVPLMADENAVLVAGAFILFALSLAALALFLPARGANEEIKKAKQVELQKVNRLVELAWKNARHRDEQKALEARLGLPGLIAYRNEIEHAREWPFASSTLMRFVLLALLPIGSWIGAALVEQIIEWVM